MKKMKGYHPAHWGSSPSVVENADGQGLFKLVELNWSEPVLLPKSGEVPKFRRNDPIIYSIVRDHGRLKKTDNVRYIGLTINPKARFVVHHVIRRLALLRGSVKFSFAIVNIKGKNKTARTKKALEEIEHILIWALWAVDHDLVNQKKQYTLPGLGGNGGGAWQIRNRGYRFSGRMPLEIVFPWMLIKVGRDNSGIRSKNK